MGAYNHSPNHNRLVYRTRLSTRFLIVAGARFSPLLAPFHFLSLHFLGLDDNRRVRAERLHSQELLPSSNVREQAIVTGSCFQKGTDGAGGTVFDSPPQQWTQPFVTKPLQLPLTCFYWAITVFLKEVRLLKMAASCVPVKLFLHKKRTWFMLRTDKPTSAPSFPKKLVPGFRPLFSLRSRDGVSSPDERWRSIFSVSVFLFAGFASCFPAAGLTFWDLVVLLGDAAVLCPLGLNYLDPWSLSWKKQHISYIHDEKQSKSIDQFKSMSQRRK